MPSSTRALSPVPPAGGGDDRRPPAGPDARLVRGHGSRRRLRRRVAVLAGDWWWLAVALFWRVGWQLDRQTYVRHAGAHVVVRNRCHRIRSPGRDRRSSSVDHRWITTPCRGSSAATAAGSRSSPSPRRAHAAAEPTRWSTGSARELGVVCLSGWVTFAAAQPLGHHLHDLQRERRVLVDQVAEAVGVDRTTRAAVLAIAVALRGPDRRVRAHRGCRPVRHPPPRRRPGSARPRPRRRRTSLSPGSPSRKST